MPRPQTISAPALDGRDYNVFFMSRPVAGAVTVGGEIFEGGRCEGGEGGYKSWYFLCLQGCCFQLSYLLLKLLLLLLQLPSLQR